MMRRFTVMTIIALLITSMTVLAQMSENDKQSFMEGMEKKLGLSSYMEQIQHGEIDPKHIAIIFNILRNTTEVYIHRQNGAIDNQVYLFPDGREAVYDKNGDLVKDGINDGSYNYFHHAEKPLYHFSFDILPWIMFGQSQTDTTTIKSRIYAYMGDLEGGIRKALAHTEMQQTTWKPDGQIQAIAVFLRAIYEGGAETFFEILESDKAPSDVQLMEMLTKLNRGLEKVFVR